MRLSFEFELFGVLLSWEFNLARRAGVSITGEASPEGAVCHYCQEPATTRDHIVPKSKGGTDGRYNLVAACQPCNAKKADSMPTCKCSWCSVALNKWKVRQPRPALPKPRGG